MYLSKVSIRNYRSIKKLDTNFQKGKNIIIGRNNSGKSNIIKALDVVLGENSPTYAKSENITQKDFFTWKEKVGEEIIEKSADDLYIFCELTREPDEDLNYDEINKGYGFYVANNRVISTEELAKNPKKIFEIKQDDVTEKRYLNPKLKNQETFKMEFNDKYHFAFILHANKDDETNTISKDIRFLYRENESLNWFMGFSAPIRNEFLQSAIIHSFRDPQMQLKLNSWSWYGKLMKHLTESSDQHEKLEEALKEVKIVADEIFATVKEDVKKSSLEIAFPNTEISFQFNHSTKNDLYKSCNIYVDDGINTTLSEKGSGIQSSTIIGLFNYYTKEINTVTSALLCIEEPELYLHPHARRVLSGRLDDFTDNGKNQVITTTHSAEFINAKDCGLNVILTLKDEKEGTTTTNIVLGQNKSLLLDSNHKEIFFADKIIICEGIADEMILKWVADEKFPNKIDENNISIIPVGGKDNIVKLSKLIRKLNIDCYIFSDFDFFLRDESDEADKYKTDNKTYRHKSIESLTNDFFKQNCIAGTTKGEELFKKTQKLRQDIKQKNSELFYKAKTSEEFDNKTAINEFLKTLRKVGIGVLSCELESLSRKTDYISPTNKINENKIFNLSLKLVNGEKMEDYFLTNEIGEFLSAVINS
jgi:putative ATP-dependent endonuclease of OLD family